MPTKRGGRGSRKASRSSTRSKSRSKSKRPSESRGSKRTSGAAKAKGTATKKLSPAYAARLKRAQAKGLSRQQARGHKPKEHVERAEKEIAKYGATKAQLKSVEHWYGTKYNPHGYGRDARVSLDELLARVAEKGYVAFKHYRSERDSLEREHNRQVRRGSVAWGGSGRDIGDMVHDDDAYDFADPYDDERWYFYK